MPVTVNGINLGSVSPFEENDVSYLSGLAYFPVTDESEIQAPFGPEVPT